MQVTKVELKKENASVSSSQNAIYTQVYRVELDGYSYTENFLNNMYAAFFILADPQIPQDYQQLDFTNMPVAAYKNAVFRCTNRDIAIAEVGETGNDSLFTAWFVTITWTANVGIVTGAITGASRLISIDRGFQPYDFATTKSYRSREIFGDEIDDLQGSPTFNIENYAGDPPSEGLTTVRNIAWLELELEYKEEFFDTKWLTTIFNTVNLYPVTVCDMEIEQACGKLTLKDARTILSGSGETFWIVKVLLEIKEESWITEWLNAGFNQLDDNGNQVPILKQDVNPDLVGTETGQETVDEAKKLDTSGKLLAQGEEPVYNNDLMIYPDDWTVIDLPTSLKGQ